VAKVGTIDFASQVDLQPLHLDEDLPPDKSFGQFVSQWLALLRDRRAHLIRMNQKRNNAQLKFVR
jgi:hypothetical protein